MMLCSCCCYFISINLLPAINNNNDDDVIIIYLVENAINIADKTLTSQRKIICKICRKISAFHLSLVHIYFIFILRISSMDHPKLYFIALYCSQNGTLCSLCVRFSRFVVVSHAKMVNSKFVRSRALTYTLYAFNSILKISISKFSLCD